MHHMEHNWTMVMLKICKHTFKGICREFENWGNLRVLTGKFLWQKSCYLESFRFLWLCSQRLTVYTSVHKCIWPFCPQVVYKPFGKTHTDTQTTAWTKTHKHNDNKKTQKQPVPTLTQLYKTAFCASAVAVAVDATKIYSLRLTLMREHTRTL